MEGGARPGLDLGVLGQTLDFSPSFEGLNKRLGVRHGWGREGPSEKPHQGPRFRDKQVFRTHFLLPQPSLPTGSPSIYSASFPDLCA